MTRAERIHNILFSRFSPEFLEITDDSQKHSGHAGASPEGETHFSVRITSALFTGMSKVTRQRTVYEALSEEFHNGLHALALKTLAPGE